MDRMTHARENITFPALLCHAVSNKHDSILVGCVPPACQLFFGGGVGGYLPPPGIYPVTGCTSGYLPLWVYLPPDTCEKYLSLTSVAGGKHVELRQI